LKSSENFLTGITIGWIFSLNVALAFAQAGSVNIIDIPENVTKSVFLLDDGAHKAYGMYLARSQDKKYMYVLSTSQVSFGVDSSIGIRIFNGKFKTFEGEKFNTNGKCWIYKMKSLPKELNTITIFPQDNLIPGLPVWAFDKDLNNPGLVRLKVEKIDDEKTNITLSGDLDRTFVSSPLFDSLGTIVGIVTKRSGATNTQNLPDTLLTTTEPSISVFLTYAAVALKDVELYSSWKETYPNQYIQNFVKESVPLFLTEKGGGGNISRSR